MAISKITTRWTPFTTTPVLATKSYPSDIDTRNTEMASRMEEIDSIGQEINQTCDDIDAIVEEIKSQAVDGGYSQEYIDNLSLALTTAINKNSSAISTNTNNIKANTNNITANKNAIAANTRNRLSFTYNMTSDADYIISTTNSQYGRIEITDTNIKLTDTVNIIVEATEHTFLFVNSTAQTLTVKTSAGSGIDVASGEAKTLRNDGKNIILYEDIVNLTGYLKDEAKSLTTNGYQKLSNGLIIQWGRINKTTNTAIVTQTFPISFPNACLSATCSILTATRINVNGFNQVWGHPTTKEITIRSANYASWYYECWYAIGY